MNGLPVPTNRLFGMAKMQFSDRLCYNQRLTEPVFVVIF